MHDPQRIDWSVRHLAELHRARAGRLDERDYFHWSLLDTFEMVQAYKKRYGLGHLDFARPQRHLKHSARWCAQAMRTHGAQL